MVRSFRNLVLAELRCVLISPRITIFRVIYDLAANLAVLNNFVNDVGARRAFGYASDTIALKPVLQLFKKIEKKS